MNGPSTRDNPAPSTPADVPERPKIIQPADAKPDEPRESDGRPKIIEPAPEPAEEPPQKADANPLRTQFPSATTIAESKPVHRPTLTDAELERRFMHHPPKSQAQTDRYSAMRLRHLELAKHVRDNTPQSAEQTRAINAIEESMFLANAAIARHT